MEWLVKHLEESQVQHDRDEEPHLRIGCNPGWMKLDQYYTLTEDSPHISQPLSSILPFAGQPSSRNGLIIPIG
ncbi:hypothetical protein BKA56DRAFT_701034 [Ilyonectria sp. MPI-CAGE-AT-0026]|nr:hypothetical protein BKA56DRAFT_701034 [Ilyonectria sp. MPI-CAGE-AT-0026]